MKEKSQEDIHANCDQIISSAKEEIQKAINESTSDLHEATRTIRSKSTHNSLLNFVCAIIVLVAAICGLTYAQNYRDGTAIAEAKAVEALAAEREKFEEEMKTAKADFEIELYSQRIQLKNDAVLEYKESSQFTEDSCKNVAEHITKIAYLYYLNNYIHSEDIENYAELKSFYNDFIKRGANVYRNKINH